MFEGIYSMTFRGTADWGMGMFVLRDGILTGADAAGVHYDGDYGERDGQLLLNVVMNVPPGVTLVQGTPAQPKPYSVSFSVTLQPRVLESSEPVLLNLPPGPVNVIFRRLRAFDD